MLKNYFFEMKRSSATTYKNRIAALQAVGVQGGKNGREEMVNCIYRNVQVASLLFTV